MALHGVTDISVASNITDRDTINVPILPCDRAEQINPCKQNCDCHRYRTLWLDAEGNMKFKSYKIDRIPFSNVVYLCTIILKHTLNPFKPLDNDFDGVLLLYFIFPHGSLLFLYFSLYEDIDNKNEMFVAWLNRRVTCFFISCLLASRQQSYLIRLLFVTQQKWEYKLISRSTWCLWY